MKQLIVAFFALLLFSSFPTYIVAQDYQEDEEGNELSDDLKLLCNRETAYSTGVSDARKGLARKSDFAKVCGVDKDRFNSAYDQGYNYGLVNLTGPIIHEPAPNHPDIQEQLPSAQTQPYTRPQPVTAGEAGVVVGGGGSSSALPYSVTPSTPVVNAPAIPGETSVRSSQFVRPHPVHELQSINEIQPSKYPKCIQTFKGKACGYNCVNSLGNVRCAPSPSQVCRANEAGQIACGYNCVSSPLGVRCALYPTDVCVVDVHGHIACGDNCRLQGGGEPICDVYRYAP